MIATDAVADVESGLKEICAQRLTASMIATVTLSEHVATPGRSAQRLTASMIATDDADLVRLLHFHSEVLNA